MSHIPQDSEEILINLYLSAFHDETEYSSTLRYQRAEVRLLKFSMAQQGFTLIQHGQILTTLSTQIAQIVNLLSTAQPATHAADSSSPAPRSLSQVFSPNHGHAVLPSPSESPATITVMSTKLSESAPILKALDLYDLILYT